MPTGEGIFFAVSLLGDIRDCRARTRQFQPSPILRIPG